MPIATTPPIATPTLDWYDRRADLMPGMAFRDFDGDLVQLDRRVPGDGTQWYAAVWSNGAWSFDDHTVEPGDLHDRVPEMDDRPSGAAPPSMP